MADLLVMEPFGKIPRWAAMPPKNSYLGFFRSEFDVRWFFLAEPGRIRLCGSESAWETVHELRPTAEQLDQFESWDLMWPQEACLNRDEILWVRACLSSSIPTVRLECVTAASDEKRLPG